MFAVGFFATAYFYYYRGSYEPPPEVEVPLTALEAPTSSFRGFEETATLRKGLLVLDAAHRNDFSEEEMTTLLSRVAARGYDMELLGETARFGGFRSFDLRERLFLMGEKLRQADSFAVVLPEVAFSRAEVDMVEEFVSKGGKLLLIADPARDHNINSLANRFGIEFQPGYLYNTVEYDLNFQDIFVRDFRPNEITSGLTQIALYTAGAIKTTGAGLAITDGNTRSSIVERPESFFPIGKGKDDHVVAVSDLTFMIPPQNSVLDNDRLISNIADFLTTSDRSFVLSDFPYFFKSDVDILLGRASLFDVATELKTMLSGFQIDSEVKGAEDFRRDTVYLGLYEDASRVVQYLDVAGIQVNGTLRTPFTPNIATEGTSVLLLNSTRDRKVLVILADSQRALLDIVGRLGSGTFRDGLADDLAGVYRSS